MQDTSPYNKGHCYLFLALKSLAGFPYLALNRREKWAVVLESALVGYVGDGGWSIFYQ